METILRSKSKTVNISTENPFVIIGERINPTGRKKLAAELKTWNFERVIEDAKCQVEAGAHVLDVNVGVPGIDEPRAMVEAIKLINQVTDVPLCFDSSRSDALEAALQVYDGKALVNSVSGEENKLKEILPVIKEYGAAVIALPLDDKGIPNDPQKRLSIASKIVEQAEKIGIGREDIIIDCLTMTLSSNYEAAKVTLDSMKLVKKELGCNMNLGVSNISFGLPDRDIINSIFMVAAIENGLTCAIIDPTKDVMKTAVLVADMIRGKDKHCLKYITSFRNKQMGN